MQLEIPKAQPEVWVSFQEQRKIVHLLHLFVTVLLLYNKRKDKSAEQLKGINK